MLARDERYAGDQGSSKDCDQASFAYVGTEPNNPARSPLLSEFFSYS